MSLPDDCENHADRDYVNLMATIELQKAVGIEDAVSVLNEVREHERNAFMKELKEYVLRELREKK